MGLILLILILAIAVSWVDKGVKTPKSGNAADDPFISYTKDPFV